MGILIEPNIGDRVILKKDYGISKKGWIGNIVNIFDGIKHVNVEFDLYDSALGVKTEDLELLELPIIIKKKETTSWGFE